MLISWNITKACNLKCEHCYRDAGNSQNNELSLEEGKTLLSDLKSLGFRLIIFSGGEPLLRDDLYELISFSRSLGLISVLGTNGTLIDDNIAQKLKQVGLKRVGISLDSVIPQRHDRFRGIDKSWEKAVGGMKSCKKVGLEFQVHTTVTTKNINEVLNITDFAQKIGAQAHHIFFLVPTGRGKNIDTVIPSAAEYESLLTNILEKQSKVSIELKPVCAPQFTRIARTRHIDTRFEKGCLAGVSYACILPDGTVHPCPYLPIDLGNVREQGIIDIWQKNETLKKLRDAEWGGKCGICEFKDICSGCRAAAFYQSQGDYLAEDINCSYEPKRKKIIEDPAI
ncbi:MAG: radical SAM protein [PVC group bacterium]|nr:radical SAM protein [PVC group bacterium]